MLLCGEGAFSYFTPSRLPSSLNTGAFTLKSTFPDARVVQRAPLGGEAGLATACRSMLSLQRRKGPCSDGTCAAWANFFTTVKQSLVHCGDIFQTKSY